MVTCWTPSLAALTEAVALGANLVLSHEPLTWGLCGHDPEAGLRWYEERHISAKVPNQRRLAFTAANGLTVYRYHSNWDWAPVYGQVDSLVRRLGLGERVGGQRVAPVYAVAPLTVAEMAERARREFSLGPLRVIGDPERLVSRVAICHGGFGQMFTFPEIAADAGAELAIFGEMLDYTIRYCVEVDLAAVELGHCGSEHPGMEAMAEFLRERLPAGPPVQCVHSGQPWQLL